jgi:hypothetical protein
MRWGLLLCACVVFADSVSAQPESTPTVQAGSPDSGVRQRPGEYPDHLFREHMPAPVATTSEEFTEKYLFGDWLGVRSELADRGIRPLVLFITDPFANTTGGLRRGVSEYDTSSWIPTS